MEGLSSQTLVHLKVSSLILRTILAEKQPVLLAPFADKKLRHRQIIWLIQCLCKEAGSRQEKHQLQRWECGPQIKSWQISLSPVQAHKKKKKAPSQPKLLGQKGITQGPGSMGQRAGGSSSTQDIPVQLLVKHLASLAQHNRHPGILFARALAPSSPITPSHTRKIIA